MYGCCQGERGAVRTAVRPTVATDRRKPSSKIAAIVQENARRYLPGKGLAQLLARPHRRRVRRHEASTLTVDVSSFWDHEGPS